MVRRQITGRSSGPQNPRKIEGNHIITSKIEHHALLHTCEFLEKEGYEVTYLDVDKDGLISLEQLKNAITDKTILISIMIANNEVGTIQPIKEIAAIAKEHGILVHTDAVQALGNIPIDVKDLCVDMLSISAHKIYGPKGVGALYIRRGLVITNLLHGGAQEIRNDPVQKPAGHSGFWQACELLRKSRIHIKRLQSCGLFPSEIMGNIPDVGINGSMEHRLPGNLNLVFNYIEEAMLLYMDLGILRQPDPLVPLRALPVPCITSYGSTDRKAYSSIRFTIGDFTTKEDIDSAVQEITDIVEQLRSFSPFDKDHVMETSQKCNCQA